MHARSILATVVLLTALLSANHCEAGWTTYTPANGLGAPIVNAIAEDSHGVIWFGCSWALRSQGVLCNFDGLTFTSYIGDEAPGGPTLSMLRTSNGGMLFATIPVRNAFDRVQSRLFLGGDRSVYPFRERLASEEALTAIAEDRAHIIWLGAQGHLYYLGTGGLRDTSALLGAPVRSIRALACDQRNRLWVAMDADGLYCIDQGLVQHYSMADGSLPSDYVSSLMVDGNGDIWVGTYGGGIVVFSNESHHNISTKEGLPSDVITALTQDPLGRIWAGTSDAGICRFDGVRWSTLSSSDGLVSNNVSSIFADHLGNLWIGTNMGVSRFDGAAWYPAEGSGLPPGTVIQTAIEGSDGTRWFGSSSGLFRLSGERWSLVNSDSGYFGTNTTSSMSSTDGRLWFGTLDHGVNVLTGSSWENLYEGTPLQNGVHSMCEDSSGGMWFALAAGDVARMTSAGQWQAFPRESLGIGSVKAIACDPAGTVWFGGDGYGPSGNLGCICTLHLGPLGPGSFQIDQQTLGMSVETIRIDANGRVWVGGQVGASLWDGVWHRNVFTLSDFRLNATGSVKSIQPDQYGNVWFGVDYGLAGAVRYSDGVLNQFSTVNGLQSNTIFSVMIDRSGYVWFGGLGGVSKYSPDYVPPKTIIVSSPIGISTNPTVAVGWVTAVPEESPVNFEYCLDCQGDNGWSGWSTNTLWSGQPGEGGHVLNVRARDRWGNIESPSVSVPLVVDSQPPAPELIPPGKPFHGTVQVIGTTADDRYSSDTLFVKLVGANGWTLMKESLTAVQNGVLAEWDTENWPDGDYDVRLVVADYLGLVGSAQMRVTIDNRYPSVAQTVPATVTIHGGDVYTTNQDVHLYFPPGAFVSEATVNVDTTTVRRASESLSPSYHIQWDTSELQKPAVLDIAVAGGEGNGRAVYYSSDGSTWTRKGGTEDGGRIALSIQESGNYSVWGDIPSSDGDMAIRDLSLTPRVISLSKSYADDNIAIGFTLGRASKVSVRVYNRAGRFVCEVPTSSSMSPGRNLVRWNGKDNSGTSVPDGMYVVTVRSNGAITRKTFAVVK